VAVILAAASLFLFSCARCDRHGDGREHGGKTIGGWPARHATFYNLRFSPQGGPRWLTTPVLGTFPWNELMARNAHASAFAARDCS